ncbi:MAG: hypothetical protein NC120_06630 [Ruminococcus sp.]|nr:hypothetical protein [Ruminococcus sp.]
MSNDFFCHDEIKAIRRILEKGNNVMIRQRGGEILIMEEKAKVICRFDKARFDEKRKPAKI